ncbi:hypothetical protein LguiB_018083 [Lonicera macranthoides]
MFKRKLFRESLTYREINKLELGLCLSALLLVCSSSAQSHPQNPNYRAKPFIPPSTENMRFLVFLFLPVILEALALSDLEFLSEGLRVRA